MSVTCLSERRYKAGYVVKQERYDGNDAYGGPPLTMKLAYTLNGDYIGNSRWAYRLCKKRGILPEKADPDHNICSIGFSEQEQKWYGWSHRAMYGFGIGSSVNPGDCAYEPYGRGSWTAQTLEDAKEMAIAFAESVG